MPISSCLLALTLLSLKTQWNYFRVATQVAWYLGLYHKAATALYSGAAGKFEQNI